MSVYLGGDPPDAKKSCVMFLLKGKFMVPGRRDSDFLGVLPKHGDPCGVVAPTSLFYLGDQGVGGYMDTGSVVIYGRTVVR